MAAISNHVSLTAPFRVGATRLESCLILWILNEDSKCSELHVAVCVKHTLQKKVSCLQQVSLIQPGHIWVESGSVGHPGQWYWPGFNLDVHAASSWPYNSLPWVLMVVWQLTVMITPYISHHSVIQSQSCITSVIYHYFVVPCISLYSYT